jgi:hypothetical protein
MSADLERDRGLLLVRHDYEAGSVPIEVRRRDDGTVWAGPADEGQSTWFEVPVDAEPVLCFADAASLQRGLVGLLPASPFPAGCTIQLACDGVTLSEATVQNGAWALAFSPHAVSDAWIEWRDRGGELFATRRLRSTSGFSSSERLWGHSPSG